MAGFECNAPKYSEAARRAVGAGRPEPGTTWWRTERNAVVIDYILVGTEVSGGWAVEQFGVLAETYDGRPPSDHRPILAELRPSP
ncbi:hypothetical protein PAPYR_1543 [Paratrimastix pyriformis]|uniref:Endonuclease/exonuclease/phosphatase domain-containing protein n=1 Tax=Paratrimastix pyriformis TaxID=342808 RepID=A0ABQ8URV8_9EUKA|nr:hypothetical protein PAPYR_1543 [Paratrimastix pyriformis]